jgi:hypothetical protein
MRCLVESQVITNSDIPENNPGAGADVAVNAIVTMHRSALASQFLRELLGEVESPGAFSDELGVGATVFLFYLQVAILNGTRVEMYSDEYTALLDLIDRLPSTTAWKPHILVVERS